MTSLLSNLPLTGGKAYTQRTIKKGRETGHWLSTIPSAVNGNSLGNQEFQDAARMRYAMVPINLPEKCDGCGAKFTLEHANSCKHGGLIIGRHDEIQRELSTIAAMALRESAVRAKPLINPGTYASIKSNSDSNNVEVSSEDRGDILVRGLWAKQQDGIIDVRVTHTDAPSYRDREPDKVLQSQEREKKKKYLNNCLQQRRTFTPFVVSSDGLLGREAKSLIKQLSVLLTEKWNKPYSVVCGIICSRISIAIVRASHQCIRGSRIPACSMSKQIQWEDGGGTGLYRIYR